MDGERKIVFAFLSIGPGPRQTPRIELPVKRLGIGPMSIGNNGFATWSEMLNQKINQGWKNGTVVENLGSKNEREALVKRVVGNILAEVKLLGVVARTTVQLGVGTRKRYGFGLFVSKGHSATFQAGNDPSQAKPAAEVENGLVGAINVFVNVAGQGASATPQQRPVGRLFRFIPEERFTVYPAFQILDAQEAQLVPPNRQFDGLGFVPREWLTQTR